MQKIDVCITAGENSRLHPQQMYEAVKKYETYVARNKRLEGKGASSSANQQRATGHTLGYKPWFHKTTAFAATIEESEDNAPHHQESSPQEDVNSFGAQSSQEDDEGLFIPSYLEEALPDDPTLQVKMPVPCGPSKWRPEDALPVTSQVIFEGTIGNMRKKWDWDSAAKGASPKQVGSREGKTKTPSARLNHIPSKSLEVRRAPYLNPDAFYRFIGPKNLGKALIDDELTTCFLDNGAQLNFITLAYAQE